MNSFVKIMVSSSFIHQRFIVISLPKFVSIVYSGIPSEISSKILPGSASGILQCFLCLLVWGILRKFLQWSLLVLLQWVLGNPLRDSCNILYGIFGYTPIGSIGDFLRDSFANSSKDLRLSRKYCGDSSFSDCIMNSSEDFFGNSCEDSFEIFSGFASASASQIPSGIHSRIHLPAFSLWIS